MRRSLSAVVAVILLSAPVGAAAAPTAAPAPANRYTLCNFDRASVPANPYPYSFLITTRHQYTSNASIRRSVRSIQQFLRDSGFTNRVGGPTQVDGKYGPATAYAVKQFQRRFGLAVDGKVGRQTWRAMAGEYCWWF